MTEEEWRTSTDPRAMCEFVRTATARWKTRWLEWVRGKQFRVSDRKWRLIELAVCEQVATKLAFDQLDALLPAARKHARTSLTHMERNSAASRVMSWFRELRAGPLDRPRSHIYRAWRVAASLGRLLSTPPEVDTHLAYSAMNADNYASMLLLGLLPEPGVMRFLAQEDAELADDVRDILGNVFAVETADPVWLLTNDGAARRVAELITASGDYSDMPVLADALEDAGCTSDAILSHCRQTTRHVRGCWVVDLLLGRE